MTRLRRGLAASGEKLGSGRPSPVSPKLSGGEDSAPPPAISALLEVRHLDATPWPKLISVGEQQFGMHVRLAGKR